MQPECLILDDSRLVRAIARHLLEEMGVRVTESENGHEALKACGTSPPDMVLVDWNMPEMSGLDFIQALRARDDIPQPKLLLCSTETRLGIIRSALRAGADSYMKKPFDRETLTHRMRRFGLI